MPDLVTTMVVGLSLTLFGVVVLLARDVRRRARAESELAESLAFRKAMEDSLVTGLRARDLEARTTYVNPAFCAMVGFDADELLSSAQPPYWPAELAAEYQRRQEERLASGAQSREAFETTFVRKNGERFPAMLFESALRDASGAHAGWMSAIVDLSAQRRVEEVARQQQDRLQATARLATIGEMASLLSHELNQPLSAIAAYATGTLNMMDAHTPGAPLDAELWGSLHVAARQIAQQSERAGRVIKSVHDFVRRRENAREAVGCRGWSRRSCRWCACRRARATPRSSSTSKPAPRSGLRPRDGRTGAAEPDAQRHPGDAGQPPRRAAPLMLVRGARAARRSGCCCRSSTPAPGSTARSRASSSRRSSRRAAKAWASG